MSCFVLFCFVLFCFVLFCFVLFCFVFLIYLVLFCFILLDLLCLVLVVLFALLVLLCSYFSSFYVSLNSIEKSWNGLDLLLPPGASLGSPLLSSLFPTSDQGLYSYFSLFYYLFLCLFIF